MRRLLFVPFFMALLTLCGASADGADGARTVCIADFESDADFDRLSAVGLSLVRVPAWKAGQGHYLRAVSTDAASFTSLTFEGVPTDIRGYEALTFRARRLLDGCGNLRAGLVDVSGRRFDLSFAIPNPTWTDVRIPFARACPGRDFDPSRVMRLSLIGCAAFELDDVTFVAGDGDWRAEGSRLREAFGDRRLDRVQRVRTRYFDVYSDSIGGRKLLPPALEETYEFVRGALGVDAMDTHLPVYLFQDHADFTAYLMRITGWPRRVARQVAGIGGKERFATWYAAPRSPVVTHELTHSVFARAAGGGGGSWLQEGAAVYVEKLHEGRSAAQAFAHRLRQGEFAPLVDFMTVPLLASSRSRTGRRYPPGLLYAQAGAFFEYLLRGPLLLGAQGEREPGLPPQILALARGARRASLEAIEHHLGHSISEVEAAWLRWGRRPPPP